MKIYAWSDLHNEFSLFAPPLIAADVVVLAGDIDIGDRGVRWANSAFACPVVYVAGNHEFYRGHIDKSLEKMRSAASAHVHVLNDESWQWNGVRFLGATSWTDFSSTGDVSAASREALELMSDYRVIRADASYRRLRPRDIAIRSEASYAWLAIQLATPFEGLTVVVTHHAPLLSVAGDKQSGHLTAAYANDWPELVEKADVWFFGHTHQAVDKNIMGCRVISNPRGYPKEQTGFNVNLEIDL